MHSLGQSLGPLGVHSVTCCKDLGSLQVLALQDLEDLESLGPSVTCCTLSSYLFMHSLGDVWHLGSEDLESLQVLGPCYLYAFLR